MWHKGIVLKGSKLGRKIGFPTLNLDPTILPKELREGVYATWILFKEKTYPSALYLGPRLVLGDKKRVLEIYVIGFDQDLYGKTIAFQIKDFIRPVRNFSSLPALKKQLGKDVNKIQRLLTKENPSRLDE